MDMQMPNDAHAEIREEVRKLCARFPGEYWRELDQRRGYPTEFVTDGEGLAHPAVVPAADQLAGPLLAQKRLDPLD